MMGIVHIKYHEPSATDARQRIVSFFNAHLKEPDSGRTGPGPASDGADA